MSIVKAHTSIIGDTGYNCHSRNFFIELDKLIPVQVRNYTIGSSWVGYNNDEPHNGEYYIDDQLKKMLVEQTLYTPNGREEFPLYTRYKNVLSPYTQTPNVHIILNETNHHYFYDDYDGLKIAYNVWETTRQPDVFFQKLQEYDQVWVPTEWQRQCTIEQGISAEKVKVVREGVDVNTFQPKHRETSIPNDRPFRFLLVGRWDYRKSTKEIIETFVKTFSEDENVELILSVDNPFATDGMKTTEERLKKWNIYHKGLKIVNHLSKEEYVEMIKTSDVFISCARGEGWNLPLIEAMSCGIPCLYSNWGGQLEFAEGKGIPVEISHETPASVNTDDFTWSQNAPGMYVEPDFNDLSIKMRESYENFEIHKNKALIDSVQIREVFTWENAAQTAKEILDNLLYEPNLNDVVSVVIARADTDEKKKLLKECIESLDTDVILSTNYPVDFDLQSNVDYYIYTKENPILTKDEFEKYNVGYFKWKINEDGKTVYTPFEFEHGYAAYCLSR
jgi:glycosyltransferase involved in cell wall biosynthesis